MDFKRIYHQMSRKLFFLPTLILTTGYSTISYASTSLYLAYPPAKHTTTAASIFFIGTAPLPGEVLINDQVIERSQSGHFAPSLPLKIGENKFTLRYQDQVIERVITRVSTQPELISDDDFAPDSFTPTEDITRLPQELICFGAVAPSEAQVTVEIANQTISLFPQENWQQLPPNTAIYTPNTTTSQATINYYQGCTSFSQTGFLGNPLFKLDLGDRRPVVTKSDATVTIIPPDNLDVVEVISNQGVARTGPSTTYSRLTPLPEGTRASVTGKQGEWLRLDYGGWIKGEETRLIPRQIPPQTFVSFVNTRAGYHQTEVIFPLQVPVPVKIRQTDTSLTLTLYNAIAQTDTIRFDDHPWLKRLDWQQVTPNQVEYTIHFKSPQQWGYDLGYDHNNLILTIQHPPAISPRSIFPLQDITILLDPGHGGSELGAKGPTGYPEKDINLIISQLLAQELEQLGAKVVLTRETDVDMSLEERVEMIAEVKPAIALSIHYNALPDAGDAINTSGISTFWYHPQAHDLAVFLHNHLVKSLNRPSYGVYWNNLALTRPHYAPTVLLELGFMINPTEFEWIVDPQSQQELSESLAEGILLWFEKFSNLREFP